MNNEKKILFLVHLPPPIHGAAIMNSSLVESKKIRTEFDTHTINITAARSIADIGRFSVGKFTNSIRQALAIRSALKKFRPSIVYLTLSPTGFAFFRDAFFVYLAVQRDTRIVLHLHGKGISSSAAESSLFRKIAAYVFRKSTVIFLSEHLVYDVREFLVRPYFVVPNGIALVSAIEEKKWKQEKPTLLFLSNYVESKGILVLIDAVEKIAEHNRSFSVKLVGNSFDLTKEEIIDIVNRKTLQDIIEVTGPKYGEEKYEVLKNADLLVFPTFYSNEAFPLVILEAMQFALPVISTPEGGIPDMVSDGETGYLVPQRDPEALAEKIELLLSNPELRVQMGRRGREKFLEKFSLPVFEQNMLDVFNKVITQKQS